MSCWSPREQAACSYSKPRHDHLKCGSTLDRNTTITAVQLLWSSAASKSTRALFQAAARWQRPVYFCQHISMIIGLSTSGTFSVSSCLSKLILFMFAHRIHVKSNCCTAAVNVTPCVIFSLFKITKVYFIRHA